MEQATLAWRPRRRLRNLLAISARNLVPYDISCLESTSTFYVLWSLETVPPEIFAAISTCRGRDGDAANPPGGPPPSELELQQHAKWLYTSEQVPGSLNPDWVAVTRAGQLKWPIHDTMSGQLRICVFVVHKGRRHLPQNCPLCACAHCRCTPDAMQWTKLALGARSGAVQEAGCTSEPPTASGESNVEEGRHAMGFQNAGGHSEASAARGENNEQGHVREEEQQEGERWPSGKSAAGESASATRHSDLTTLGSLLREHAAEHTAGEWVEMVVDAVLDMHRLTYLGPTMPEQAEAKLLPNSILLQLTDGYYVFPKMDSLAVEVGSTCSTTSRSSGLKTYNDGHIKDMLAAKLLGARSAVDLVALEPSVAGTSSSGSASNMMHSASSSSMQQSASVTQTSKVASAAEVVKSMDALCSQRHRLQEAKRRRQEIRAQLEDHMQARQAYADQRHEVFAYHRNSVASHARVKALSENLQIALDRNAARREALPQRARAVLDVGGEMLKGVRRLHEASALLVGSAGMGQVAQLQKALVARRCRLCYDLASAFAVGPRTVPVCNTSLGDIAARLDESWWSHSVGPGTSDADSDAGASSVDLTPGWGKDKMMQREVARLEISGLEIDPRLGSRGMVGNMSWDSLEEKRTGAALGYVAQVVTLLSSYLQVPLRYPLSHCGSRSFIMDFAPTLPKALIQTTQDGRLMLKQNKFSLRSLRRGLAGKGPNKAPTEFPLFYAGNERTRFAYAIFLLNKDIEQLLNIHSLATAGPSHLLQNLSKLFAAAQSALPPSVRPLNLPRTPSPGSTPLGRLSPGGPFALDTARGGELGTPTRSLQGADRNLSTESEVMDGLDDSEVQAMFTEALYAAEREYGEEEQVDGKAVSEAGRKGGRGGKPPATARPGSALLAKASLNLGRFISGGGASSRHQQQPLHAEDASGVSSATEVEHFQRVADAAERQQASAARPGVHAADFEVEPPEVEGAAQWMANAAGGGGGGSGSDQSSEVDELMAQAQDSARLSAAHKLDVDDFYRASGAPTASRTTTTAAAPGGPPGSSAGGGLSDEDAAVQALLAQAMDEVRLAKGQSLPSLPGNYRIDDSGANSEGHCDLRNAGIAGLTLSDSGSGSDQECHDDALSAKTGDDSDIEDLLLDLPPVPKQKPTLHR